jgi:hypothetical protein
VPKRLIRTSSSGDSDTPSVPASHVRGLLAADGVDLARLLSMRCSMLLVVDLARLLSMRCSMLARTSLGLRTVRTGYAHHSLLRTRRGSGQLVPAPPRTVRTPYTRASLGRAVRTAHLVAHHRRSYDPRFDGWEETASEADIEPHVLTPALP